MLFLVKSEVVHTQEKEGKGMRHYPSVLILTALLYLSALCQHRTSAAAPSSSAHAAAAAAAAAAGAAGAAGADGVCTQDL